MRVDWQRLASIGICFTLAAVFIFLLGKYIATAFLPFLIAWLMALFTNYAASALSARIKLPQKLCSAGVLILLFLLIGLLLYLGINRFIDEIEKFIGNLTKDGVITQSLSTLAKDLNSIGERLPFINHLKEQDHAAGFGNKLDEMITSFLKGFASDLGTAMTSFAARAIRSLPSILLFIIITVIASFYFSLDFEAMNQRLALLMPKAIQKKLPRLKVQTKSLAARYLKAYAILMVLTFFELFIGLSLIGADYALLLATVISLLDVLPVLGVGTVLIPWAVFCFFTYDFGRGLALVILWGVVTVIRQIAEPKIVGGTIGLHPAATLIGMYVGFRLFGIAGMFLAPAAIIAAKAYFGGKYVVSGASALDNGTKK